ncbi:hypothetical protein [Methylobacterium symbioticum]|nr:hypothetical protein [Methylobacterium symbioticum]
MTPLIGLTVAETRLLRRLAGKSQKVFGACEAHGLMRRGLAMLDTAKQTLIITEQGERLYHNARQ